MTGRRETPRSGQAYDRRPWSRFAGLALAAPRLRRFLAAGGGRHSAVCLVLASAFLASILVVGPGGEFPLNDDWSFVRSTRTLVIDHDWRPLGWASMTQISHALLGWSVCAVSSCSFEHLRLAVLAAGLALLLCSFTLFRWLGASTLAGTVAACGVVFNPIFYPLTYTFMTDVDFALLLLLAAAGCVAALKTARWRDVLLATLLLLLATLSRQLALAMTLSFLVVTILWSRDRMVIRMLKGGLPFAVCGTVLLLYESWMRRTGRLPALYDVKYRDLAAVFAAPGHVMADTVTHLVLSCLYLGFICLPILLLRFPFSTEASDRPGWASRRGSRPDPSIDSGTPESGLHWPNGDKPAFQPKAALWASALAVAALAFMVSHGVMMPLLGNVLGKSGVGPFTLRDTYVLGLGHVPELPTAVWAGVTGLGLLGLWLLVYHAIIVVVNGWHSARAGTLSLPHAVDLFGVLTTALYLLPLLPGDVYDRYLVVIAPILCLGLVASGRSEPGEASRIPALAACTLTVGMAVVSVLTTHDYLAWNRARWQAIADVEVRHEADAARLDGGFEYNGYYGYDPLYVGDASKSWWWVADDAVQIAFGPIPGTDVLRRYAYETWFPVDRRFIVVLRRTRPRAVPRDAFGSGPAGSGTVP